MLTTVNLPDTLFQESEAIAASRGATVEQLIVESVKKYVLAMSLPAQPKPAGSVELPVIRSRRPGTLDLSNFDFDDLLA
jgi:hypothetical protein